MGSLTKLVVLSAVTVLMVGCNDEKAEQIQSLSTQLDICKKEIKVLDQRNRDLEAVVMEIKALSAKPPELPELQKIVMANMDAAMSNRVAHLVDSVFLARVGTKDDIEAIFSDVLNEQIAVNDQLKEQEREKKRETARVERAERRERWEEQRRDRVAEELGLSEEQNEQVATITKESSTKMRETMREVWDEKGFDAEALRTARQKVTDERNAEMQEVLSEEQYNSYTNSQGGRSAMIESFFSGFGGGARGGNRSSTPSAPTIQTF
jgi:hypothetical protein